ncbi:MAG: hypothetical protein L3K18_02780 [Thermoplasmata archaeon]|nr:hypothetical protein [Thermoplasmata archaeon]
MTPRLVATGTILLAVGLTLTAVVAEWFAAFDACLASTSCVAADSGSILGWFLGILAMGVLLAALGAVVAIIGSRTEPGDSRGVTP